MQTTLFPLHRVNNQVISDFVSQIKLQLAESEAEKANYYKFNFRTGEPFDANPLTDTDIPRFIWTPCIILSNKESKSLEPIDSESDGTKMEEQKAKDLSFVINGN